MEQLVSSWILTSCQLHRVTSGWTEQVYDNKMSAQEAQIPHSSRIRFPWANKGYHLINISSNSAQGDTQAYLDPNNDYKIRKQKQKQVISIRFTRLTRVQETGTKPDNPLKRHASEMQKQEQDNQGGQHKTS